MAFLGRLIDLRSSIGFPYKMEHLFNVNLEYLIEFGLEIAIVFICWNIFLLLVYTYHATKNLRNLFISVSFLWAGIMNLIHSVMVFNQFDIAYYSGFSFFDLAPKLILVSTVLISWLINTETTDSYKFYFYFLVVSNSLYSIISICLLFKLWFYFPRMIIAIKAIVLIGLIINIVYYVKQYNYSGDKYDLLVVKGLVFLLLSEILLSSSVDFFGTVYFTSHFYKLVAFIYFFRSFFGEEITNGVLVQKEIEIKDTKLNYQQEMIKELRSQRHDFKNELQTIYTMLQLDKGNEAEKYIKDVHCELSETKELEENEEYDNELKPVLLCKEKVAEKNNIDLKAKVKLDPSMIAMPYSKFTKILFNLLDNALDAVMEKEYNRKVEVNLFAKKKKVILNIYNNGPIIPANIKDNIFTPGYTTKDKGSGFGLHIVKSLIEDYGGEINVHSKEESGTKFICQLPKKEFQKNIDNVV
ncbi:hypothetical protein JCM16358_25890 [Halanaerocella petrolearia]